MFKNTYQSGLLSIFYSCGSNPLAIWDMEVQNGHIKRVTDTEVNSIVLEIVSTNVARTFITCPKRDQALGIRLPFLVMILKNMKRYFSFEITILDDRNMRRRFRISNFQTTTKIKPFCTTMPIGLSGGWNQIQFNLSDFTRRAYGSQFMETLRVQIHANARLRRIYFSDRLYSEEELPQDYKLYMPLERKVKKKEKKQEVAPPVKAQATEATPVEELVEAKVVSTPATQTPALEPEIPAQEPEKRKDEEKPMEPEGENAAELAEETSIPPNEIVEEEPHDEGFVGDENAPTNQSPPVTPVEEQPDEVPQEALQEAPEEALEEEPLEALLENAMDENATPEASPQPGSPAEVVEA